MLDMTGHSVRVRAAGTDEDLDAALPEEAVIVVEGEDLAAANVVALDKIGNEVWRTPEITDRVARTYVKVGYFAAKAIQFEAEEEERTDERADD